MESGNRGTGAARVSSGLPTEPEPWLRGTHSELNPLVRQFVHSMEQVEEDVERWCAGLIDEEVNARPMGLAAVAFHLRHIARSLDRLLSYAEGTQLDATQIALLKTEMEEGSKLTGVLHELRTAVAEAKRRARAFKPEQYNRERVVGRKMLPTTVGSLLVHAAEHTQRHLGQAIVTAKVVMAMRSQQP